MLVGYARVPTREQNQALQLDALQVAGRAYTEKVSGTQRERSELKATLDYAREGDTLVSNSHIRDNARTRAASMREAAA